MLQVPLKRQFEILARNDYSFYLEYVHGGHYRHAKHTLLMCEKLAAVERGELKRLMIFMPPRHSKSQTCSESFPSWFLARNPDRRVMLISYGDELAKSFGRKNRQKLAEFGESIFGVTVAHGSASVNHWNIEGHAGGMLSQGVGSALTGFGASLVIIDDPIRNREVANSEVQRRKIYEEYKSSIMTRLTSDARVIVIQTRWHESDLSGEILANDPEGTWEVLNLPAIAEEGDMLGRAVGEPLWAENGFDRAWLDETKRTIGGSAFASLYQQRPAPDEGAIIKREWLRFYDTVPSRFEEVIISLDAAFKGNEDSDYVAFTVWGRIGAEKYLVHVERARMDFPTTVTAFKHLCARFPLATAKLVEDKANGSAIIDFLKRDISGIVPITPHETKIARLFAVSPQFEAGNVYLPSEKLLPSIHDYVYELTMFPNARNDDMVDSTSQALNYLESRTVFLFGRA